MSDEQPKMQKSFGQKLSDSIFNVFTPGQAHAQQHRGGSQISFQSRLILANMLITFLVIAGMGYYVYYRAQQTNTYLTQQLDASVRQQAEAVLQKTSIEQVDALNNFFVSQRKDISNFGSTTARMLAQETLLSGGTYWDATQSLNRLSNGSWDNPAEDLASVFIPASKNLTPSLVSELNTLAQLNFVAPVHLSANPDIVAIYFGGPSGETLYYPNVDLAALVPADFDVTQRPWFVNAASSQNTDKAAVWSDPYLDAASNGLVITTSVPVYDESGKIRGVSAMDIQLNKITEIVSNIRVGDTGHAFLLDKDKRLIAMPAASYEDFGITPDEFPLGNTLDQVSPDFQDVVNKMSAGESGLTTIKVNGVENFVMYQPIPEVGYSLAVVVPSQELQKVASSASEQIAKSTRNSLLFGGLLAIVLLVFSFFAALVIENRLMMPLRNLTSTAEEITRGNLNAEASVQGRDEIGRLATTFNSMTSQLRDMIGSLESRVADRTKALATTTEVSRRLSTIVNEKELVTEVVDQVNNAFGYYHTQIYFYDEAKENLVMAGGTGEVGEKMLAQDHKISKGRGLVGRAAESNETVLVSDTSQDPDWLPNTLLPDTKAEIAIPISIGDQVLGVLDVQHNVTDGLQREDVDSLQSIANQVAVALQNTRQYRDSQQFKMGIENSGDAVFVTDTKGTITYANSTFEKVYGFPLSEVIGNNPRIIKSGLLSTENYKHFWGALLSKNSVTGEIVNKHKDGHLVYIAGTNSAIVDDAGEIVGFLAVHHDITEQKRNQGLTDQRAKHQEALNLITQKIQSTTSVESALQMAARELGHALGSQTSVSLAQSDKQLENN